MDVKTAYEQWLHDFAADADTIADLKGSPYRCQAA